VPAAALRKRLLDKLQLHHRLVRPSQQVRSSVSSAECLHCNKAATVLAYHSLGGPASSAWWGMICFACKTTLSLCSHHSRQLSLSCNRVMWRWSARARSSPSSFRGSGGLGATSQVRSLWELAGGRDRVS